MSETYKQHHSAFNEYYAVINIMTKIAKPSKTQMFVVSTNHKMTECEQFYSAVILFYTQFMSSFTH